MAPEQARGMSVDHRADIYSLGVIAYELLTGHHPFAGRKGTAMLLAHLNEPVIRPQALAPKLPPELDELLTACLEKEAHRRPGYAQEVAVKLKRIKDSRRGNDQPLTATTDLPVESLGNTDSGSGSNQRAFLLTPPLIGRETELSRAGELLGRLLDGAQTRPGFWLALSGQSGVGKSRLLKTLAGMAKLKGCMVVEFDCPEQVRPSLESVVRAAQQLQQEIPEALTDNEWAELAAWLPRVKSTAISLPPASPELIASQGLNLFLKLVRAACCRHPLLILIDGAQWLDLESARVWNHLHRELIIVPQAASGERGERLGLLFGLRAEEREVDALRGLRAAIGKHEATELSLQPMTEGETIRFVQQLLGQSDPPNQFGKKIHRETEGNPFFIEEIMKAMIESGSLRYDPTQPDPWTIVGAESPSDDYGRIKLPGSIQQTLEKRLEGFNDNGLKLLRFAASLGKTFHFDALLAAAEMDEDEALDLLELSLKRQILSEGDERGHWFSFQHDKLREVILDQAGPRRLRRMHERLYDILKVKPQWCANPDPREDLAFHALTAERDNEALECFLAAGEARFQAALPDRAYTLLEQAHGCMQRLSEVGQSIAEEHRLELLERLVACGLLSSRFKAAEGWADRYLELSTRINRDSQPLQEVVTGARPDDYTFDPALVGTIRQALIIDPVHRGLLRYHAIGKVIPALAERWEVSPNGLLWTFYLRADAHFHNGRPVTTKDVIASWERLLRPVTKAPFSSLLAPILGADDFSAGKAETITGLEIMDEKTLRVRLREPLVIFPYLISFISTTILSAEELASSPTILENPSGCGPYQLAGKDEGRFTYQKRDDSSATATGMAPSTFRFEISANWEAESTAGLRSGQFDYDTSETNNELQLLAQACPPEFSHLCLASQLGLNSSFIVMRCDLPPFDDLRVRRAFCHALDRVEMTRQSCGEWAIPAHGLLPPGMLGYDPELQGYDYQPARVHRLLCEAGHPGGIDLSLFRAIPTSNLSRLFDAFYVRLHELGFRITMTNLSRNEYKERVAREGHSLLSLSGWYADYPDPDNFFYSIFHSRSSNVVGTNISDPQLDLWIEEGRRTADTENRIAIYRRAERRLLELAPVAFLWHRKSVVVYNADKLARPLLSLTTPLIQMDTLRPARKAGK